MGDYILNVRVDGREADDQLEKVVKQMNDIQEKAKKTEETQRKMNAARRELANYARKEREEIFNALPIEERINRLLERREQIQRRINATTSEERRTMLTLALRRNESGVRSLERERAERNRERAGEITRTALQGVPAGGLLARGLVGGGGMGAFMAGMIGATVFSVKKSMDVSDLADRLDMTTHQLQRLSFVAKASGGDLDAFVRIIDNIRKAQSEALAGNKSYISDFAALNVSLRDIKNKSAGELFDDLARGIRDGSINASKFSSQIQIMGRESKEMIAPLKNNLQELADLWDRWNLSISGPTVTALKEVGELLKTVFLIAAGGIVKTVVENVGFSLKWLKVEAIAILSLFEKIGFKRAGDMKQAVTESLRKQMAEPDDAKAEADQKQKEIDQRNAEAERIKKAQAEAAAANAGSSTTMQAAKSPFQFNHDRLADLGIYRGNVFNQQQNDIRTAIGHIRDADERLMSIERSVNTLAATMATFRI